MIAVPAGVMFERPAVMRWVTWMRSWFTKTPPPPPKPPSPPYRGPDVADLEARTERIEKLLR